MVPRTLALSEPAERSPMPRALGADWPLPTSGTLARKRTTGTEGRNDTDDLGLNGLGYGQWEYRIAVAGGDQGRLESCDGELNSTCFASGSDVPMSIAQALDVWGATGWELVGMAAIPKDRLQYVFKRPRHQGGWEGARIHTEAQRGQ
jgi:hypothetical protein